MHPKAVDHAKVELEQAEEALERLRRATDFHTVERAWSALLMALGTIYTKLEQGAKRDTKSKAWFDEVKRERRSDDLLRYLHQARNTKEHSIEDITTRDANLIRQSIQFPNGRTAEIRISLPSAVGDAKLEDTAQIKTFTGSQTCERAVALAPVTNRGVTYQVPTMHLGRPFGAVDPLAAAEAGVRYAREMIAVTQAFLSGAG